MQACSFEDGFDHIDADFSSHTDVLTRSDCSEKNLYASSILKDKIITEEFVPVILSDFIDKSLFKDVDRYSIQKVSKGNKNLMYVVNFDKGGWVIISGRFNVDNIILASGSEGYFDPNQIDCPEVRFWLEMTEEMIEQEMIDDEDNTPNEILRSGPYDNETYVWVRFILEPQYSTTYNYSNLDHLVVTKWGQCEPWNYLCPLYNSTLCPLGCTAVAVGQMLYYLHDHITLPSGLFHTVVPYYYYHYNSSGYYCTSSVNRSNYTANSPRWALMETTNPGVLTSGVQYVGDLLIDIADRAESVFRLDGTAGHTSTALFSNYFGISCTKSNFSQSTVVSSLNDSLPVLVSAKISNNSNADGHEWIIDGYNSSHTVMDSRYRWRMVPPDSLSYYDPYAYDYVYTENEMHQFFPDVIEDEIIHEYSSFINYSYRMNWGWHDNQNSNDYDNALYSFGNWNVGQNNLNYQVKIYHNFH